MHSKRSNKEDDIRDKRIWQGRLKWLHHMEKCVIIVSAKQVKKYEPQGR